MTYRSPADRPRQPDEILPGDGLIVREVHVYRGRGVTMTDVILTDAASRALTVDRLVVPQDAHDETRGVLFAALLVALAVACVVALFLVAR